jgi:hypothetical protein
VLFGTRIGGNSNESTSSGPGIGFRVVLFPEKLAVALLVGLLVAAWTLRDAVKTNSVGPRSLATCSDPDICTVTGPLGVSIKNEEKEKGVTPRSLSRISP